MRNVFESKNGKYYDLTKEELLWLKKNEKKLPQINSKKENLIFVNLKILERLL